MRSSRLLLIALLCAGVVGCSDAREGVDHRLCIRNEDYRLLMDKFIQHAERIDRLVVDSARCAESHCYCLDTAGWGSAGIRITQDGRVELGKMDHFVDANKKVDTCRWFYSEDWDTVRLSGLPSISVTVTKDSIWHCEPRGGE